ncbi:dihydrofolate reductase [Kiloniella majae]|uniref:dihydrofolate reductase n=1 Tax=Kiloniella majae TaxID=1938558 RepID=UPI000A2797B4|nr:dihydrofolate reductase [Kiloniella majae]
MTTVSLIVAHGKNRAIGKDNVMPWHIPGDLKFFKTQTMGKPVIMGRKTFQSIGRPLPGRLNIVITRDENFKAEGVRLSSSLEDALKLARVEVQRLGGDELMIIGGAQIYMQSIDLADRLYITEVDLEPEADAFFPETKVEQWSEVSREAHAPDGSTPGYAFVVSNRV